MAKIIQIADLHFSNSSSDKVYHAALQEVDGGYVVEFAFGRRFTTLSRGFKTTSPVPLEKAQKIFAKLVGEKTAKGYVNAPGVSGQVFAGTLSNKMDSSVVDTAMKIAQEKESTGIYPQLLNPIDDAEVEHLIEDPRWGAQEKKNGKRLMAKSDGNDFQIGINRKSFVVQLSPAVIGSLRDLSRQILLDGEGIGNTIYVFGMLELDNCDLRNLSYIRSYEILEETLLGHTGNGLEIVPLAVTAKDKRALYERLKAENKEGIVFKLLAASHSAGRPNSGGSQLKKKFIESASVIVLDINDKRSIKMGVFAAPDDKTPTFVGNCTIPVNCDIPNKGDIVEVEYLYAYPGGSLFQPVYLGIRDDIDADRCMAEQLKYFEAEAAA